jgi:RecB family exonuclease
MVPALSPSRASDFKQCPLLYRFRTIDKLPEPPSPDAVRGTVVHKVLEDLFDLPAHHRTPERAADLLATERQLEALWRAVSLAHETGEWLPRSGGHCTWCSFQSLCPEFGGTPPPLPDPVTASEGHDAAADLPGGGPTGSEDDRVGA